jgi:AcrR family transcriptional regulator
MGIAKEAGMAGSLFTYFETKAELFNQLYLALKGEMAATAMKGFPADAKLREQFFHIWRNWIGRGREEALQGRLRSFVANVGLIVYRK